MQITSQTRGPLTIRVADFGGRSDPRSYAGTRGCYAGRQAQFVPRNLALPPAPPFAASRAGSHDVMHGVGGFTHSNYGKLPFEEDAAGRADSPVGHLRRPRHRRRGGRARGGRRSPISRVLRESMGRDETFEVLVIGGGQAGGPPGPAPGEKGERAALAQGQQLGGSPRNLAR